MGKSKKSFWKQMYLSNGWAIDKVVVPAVGILFFFAIGFLANVILEIPESIKTDEGASYYANLIVWYFASGTICGRKQNARRCQILQTASFKRRADCCKKQQYFHRRQLLFCLYQKEVGILPWKKKSFPN